MRLATVLVLALAALLLVPSAVAGQQASAQDLIPIEITDRLKNAAVPGQPSAAEAQEIVAGTETTDPQCGGTGETLVLTLTSNDPDNPGSQDVVFWKEKTSGNATLWVAWDFLTTDFGRTDVITCEQLDYLSSEMGSVVAADKKYFGDYVDRPAGNENIDVMIFNIVDESFFDPTFPSYIAGFFFGGLNEQVNRNMIFVDSFDWANRLGDDAARPNLYEGVVAHELEHLIHHDHDVDEDSWIDEGMADLAEYLNGYGHPDGHVVYGLAFHRNGLTTWGGGLEDYGSAYLFQLYLLENFGSKAGDGTWDPAWTRALIDTQENSIAGVEAATGASFNDLYDAWILANYVDDPGRAGAGGFPIGYDEIDLAPYSSPTYGDWSITTSITDIYGSDHRGNLPISRYFGGLQSGTVEFPQGEVEGYGPVYSNYKGMQPEMNVSFLGIQESGVAPKTGSWEAASGGGHLLTNRMLALNTPVGGTLSFATWYDIEEEWDFGFVEASTDGGATWTPLAGSITRTSQNPNNSTAWANSLVGGQASTDAAITGSSGGWVTATFELPAASNVLVRFSYYTDEAVNGQGWFIDDVSVGSLSDGFEAGAANWSLGGWTRTTGLFPNDWITAIVNPVYENGKLAETQIEYVDGAPFTSPSTGTEYERIVETVDTSRLGRDAATVVFANRPGENPFASFFQLLASKGDASG